MIKLNSIHCAECTEIINQLDDDSIDLLLTSPPYDDVIKFKDAKFDYKKVINSFYRIMKPGGVIVWVMNDGTENYGETGSSFRHALCFQEQGFTIHDTMIFLKDPMQWHPNRRRYKQAFQYMFIFSKGRPKTHNIICDVEIKNHNKRMTKRLHQDGTFDYNWYKPTKIHTARTNVWKFKVGCNQSTKDKIAFKHPAIFPEKLAEDHILTWSNPGGTVLDPMCGSGTTLKMAKKNNRNYIGIDMVPEYCEIAKERLLL